MTQPLHPLGPEDQTDLAAKRDPTWPPTIGLLGGVASGKSMVARQLAELGACLLDADRAGHDVLRESAVKAALLKRWGATVIGADGEIDRRAVGRIVFAPPPDGPRELAFLEGVTHPRITVRLKAQAAEAVAAGAPAIVLDAPVMLKAGWHRMCTSIWLIDAPPAVRLARARDRGWSEEQFAAREAAQEPLTEKRRWADAVIDNSGAPAATLAQVRALWEKLVRPG